jgi:hypothetical protein
MTKIVSEYSLTIVPLPSKFKIQKKMNGKSNIAIGFLTMGF